LNKVLTLQQICGHLEKAEIRPGVQFGSAASSPAEQTPTFSRRIREAAAKVLFGQTVDILLDQNRTNAQKLIHEKHDTQSITSMLDIFVSKFAIRLYAMLVAELLGSNNEPNFSDLNLARLLDIYNKLARAAELLGLDSSHQLALLSDTQLQPVSLSRTLFLHLTLITKKSKEVREELNSIETLRVQVDHSFQIFKAQMDTGCAAFFQVYRF